MPYSFDPAVRDAIVRIARNQGVDPVAALAVAFGEGGIRWGAIGDQGTSHGPFQLRRGGALPADKDAAWANSIDGIRYAIRTMAGAGAKGLKGLDAINAIVRQFERPAAPDASVQNAWKRYQDPAFRKALMDAVGPLPGQQPQMPGLPGAPATSMQPGAPDVTKLAAIQNLSAIASGKKYDPIAALGNLLAEKQRAAATYGGYTSADDVTAATTNPQPPTPVTGTTQRGVGKPIQAEWSKLSGFGKMTPDFMVLAIQKAQALGLRVGENPYVDPIDGNHVNGSFHYQTFANPYKGKKLGRAIDISGDPQAMDAFFRWAIRYRPTELFYDPLGQYDNGRYSTQGIGNHSDHVHLSV